MKDEYLANIEYLIEEIYQRLDKINIILRKDFESIDTSSG